MRSILLVAQCLKGNVSELVSHTVTESVREGATYKDVTHFKSMACH